MAVYFKDSGLSYERYLQEQAWVDDVRLTIGDASSELAGVTKEAMQVSAKDSARLREAVEREGEATRDELAYQTAVTMAGFRGLAARLDDGFTELHLDLGEINDQLAGISTVVETGFARIETAVGSLNTSFEELVRIAKTPAQTWAYEQFHQAVEASRRMLFPEALESATRAVDGYTPPRPPLFPSLNRPLDRWRGSGRG